ncbi:MAG: P1 family peptidase, partial [Solirubrobacteraceae bacterium]
ASRRVGDHVVGALVLANFGSAPDLRFDGVPVGRDLPDPGEAPPPAGSCIAVLATDLPLDGAQLERLARRAGLGLARTGSVAHHGSGEIFLAFSVAGRRPRGAGATAPGHPEGALNDVFTAAVEATEAAVLNCLWAAPDVAGRDGRSTPGLPHERVLDLLGRGR